MSEQHPGLTDTAVTQGRDLIEHAEVEEAQAHASGTPAAGQKNPEPKPGTAEGRNTSEGTAHSSKKRSTLEKVKEALHTK